MRKLTVLATAVAAVVGLVLPFSIGGAGLTAAVADNGADAADVSGLAGAQARAVTTRVVATAYTTRIDEAALIARASAEASSNDREHLAQKPAVRVYTPIGTAGAESGTAERRALFAAKGLSCPSDVGGSTNTAPAIWSDLGVGGTTTDDLDLFARTYNEIRVENCLQPIPLANFSYDSCLEERLIWMAEDPSEDPASAWGHIGSERSDGVPSVGCDGDLAGGTGNTGSTAAYKWWTSTDHRNDLYRPGTSVDGICISFAMSHGGVPNEPYPFTRAAATWHDC